MQVIELFAPKQETIDAVHNWLRSSGLDKSRTRLSSGRNWIHFNATIAEAERLLQTKYKVYEHSSGQLHIACDDYSVPADVQKHIDFIMPTVHFDTKIVANPDRTIKRDIGANLKPGNPGNGFLPKKGPTIKGPGPQPDALQPQAKTNCNTQITPECLRALYGLPAGSIAKSSYGIVEYTPQAYLQSDLNLFYTNLATNIPAGTAPILDSVDGGVDQVTTQNFNTNGESDLDLEYAIALGMYLASLKKSRGMFIGRSVPPESHPLPSRRPRRRSLVQQLSRRHRCIILHLKRRRRPNLVSACRDPPTTHRASLPAGSATQSILTVLLVATKGEIAEDMAQQQLSRRRMAITKQI